MSDEQTVFHGGCLGCQVQKKFTTSACFHCQYFAANWDYPDLSIEEDMSDALKEKVKVIIKRFMDEKPVDAETLRLIDDQRERERKKYANG